MAQFQNKSWPFIRSPLKLESSFRYMHNISIVTIKTMCCTAPHRLYTLIQFLFRSQSCRSHKTTPYMIAAKWDTHDQCEIHRANVIHMASVKYTQPIWDTHGQCEIHTANVKYTRPMWDTHGQCEIHTANVRYTQPMHLKKLPRPSGFTECSTYSTTSWLSFHPISPVKELQANLICTVYKTWWSVNLPLQPKMKNAQSQPCSTKGKYHHISCSFFVLFFFFFLKNKQTFLCVCKF